MLIFCVIFTIRHMFSLSHNGHKPYGGFREIWMTSQLEQALEEVFYGLPTDTNVSAGLRTSSVRDESDVPNRDSWG